MSITESIGFGWVVLSTGVFTAFSLIVLIYSMSIGVRQIMIWIEDGRMAAARKEQAKLEDLEFKRIIKS